MTCYHVMNVIALILFQLFISCIAVTEDDIKECGASIFSRVNCSSVNFYYNECPIPGADEVTKIKLSQNFSQEECKFEVSFGFRATAVWVTEGCSGEFYVCHIGVRSSTTEPDSSTVDITRELTEDNSNNATLYIIIALVLVLIALIGLVAGCLLKRRQSNEKLRKLAEERQKSIQARDSKIDDDVRITPITRQPSVESIYFPEGSVDLDKFEKASVASSRSSTSGFASVSSRATGRYMPSNRLGYGRQPFVIDPREVRRGRSVPDIRTASLGHGVKSNFSYKGSQTSLNSILEVGNHGNQNRRYVQNPLKYNTIGARRSRADSTYSQKQGGMTLPRKLSQTRAIVHARHPSKDSGINNFSKTDNETDIQLYSHYEDPQNFLGMTKPSADKTLVIKKDSDSHGFMPVEPVPLVSDNIYSTVKKPKKPRPVVAPKPNKVIYSEVNMGTLQVEERSDSPGGDSDASLEENNNQHLNVKTELDTGVHVNNDHQTTQQYALMRTFKPSRDYEDVDLGDDMDPYHPLSFVKPAKF